MSRRWARRRRHDAAAFQLANRAEQISWQQHAVPAQTALEVLRRDAECGGVGLLLDSWPATVSAVRRLPRQLVLDPAPQLRRDAELWAFVFSVVAADRQARREGGLLDVLMAMRRGGVRLSWELWGLAFDVPLSARAPLLPRFQEHTDLLTKLLVRATSQEAA